MGGAAGKELLVWALFVAALFSGTIWFHHLTVVWSATRLVARGHTIFAGIIRIMGARTVSAYLLLLPRSLL
jgi:hypothetical protein